MFTRRDPIQFCPDLHTTWQKATPFITISCTHRAKIQHSYLGYLAYLVQGQTPLHVAANWDDRRVAELLLARGADTNAKNCEVSQHWVCVS